MEENRIIAGVLIVGILATTLTGCRKTNISKVEMNKPVVTLGSDSYPPYNYLNEDGIPTGMAHSIIVIKNSSGESWRSFFTTNISPA